MPALPRSAPSVVRPQLPRDEASMLALERAVAIAALAAAVLLAAFR